MSPSAPPIVLPHPDQIRAAIDETDERARLLRRLLRISIRFGCPSSPTGPDLHAAGVLSQGRDRSSS